jgi:hypothetical protein
MSNTQAIILIIIFFVCDPSFVPRVYASLHDAILTALSRPSAFICVMPEKTVLLTYTNAYHFGLIKMQRSGLSASDRTCVESRFVTGCMDEACMGLCANNSIPHCYVERLRLTPQQLLALNETSSNTTGMRASNMASNDYFKILILKWQMLNDTLHMGNGSVHAAFFLDADVLLLQNPFMHFDYIKYDFRHQTESSDGCGAAVNGGQLFVRNTAAGVKFLNNMCEHFDDIIIKRKLDQGFAPGAAKKAGASRCALDKTKFTGGIGPAHHKEAHLAGIVTFHAHGTTGNGKVVRLKKFLGAWEKFTNTTDQHRYYNTTRRLEGAM